MAKMSREAEARKFGSTSLPPNSLVSSDLRRLAVELRIILIGKTGSGKSSTGNTILGWLAFPVVPGGTSGSKRCSFRKSLVRKRNIMIVDTPGLFDSHMSTEETHKELVKCIGLAAPGPHVFLLTIPANIRISPEETDTLDLLKHTFGESMVDYTLVVFTKADEMKRQFLTEKQFYERLPDSVRVFVEHCKGRHVFLSNLSSQEKEKQVEDLINRIDYIMDNNLPKCYSNDQFKEANSMMVAHMKKMKSKRRDMRLANTDEKFQEDVVVDQGYTGQEVPVDEGPHQQDEIDDQTRAELADGGGIFDMLMEKLKHFWERIRRFFNS